MTMIIDKELYNEMAFDTSVNSNYEEDGFVVVEAGDWISEYKYEDKRNVVKHIESGKFYALYLSRSGSYFSDYYYNELETDEDGMVELQEVFPQERVILEYV